MVKRYLEGCGYDVVEGSILEFSRGPEENRWDPQSGRRHTGRDSNRTPLKRKFTRITAIIDMFAFKLIRFILVLCKTWHVYILVPSTLIHDFLLLY
jgi:hypothetical protein